MSSILDLSSRTISKIIRRMIIAEDLGCSRCSWKEGIGDIHHIKGRKIHDADNHSNLCYLCPNCHRLVHEHKIPDNELISLDVFIGDSWKKYYNPSRKGIKFPNRKTSTTNLRQYNIDREKSIDNEARIKLVLDANIDFSEYGWVGKVANTLNISHTHAKRWMDKHLNEIYIKAYKRIG